MKLILGDCIEVMQHMKDDSVDLVFFDPPYNRKKKYDGYPDNRDDYTEWMVEIVDESRRLSKRGVVVFMDGRLVQKYWRIMPDAHLIIVHKRARGIKVNGFVHQYHALLAEATPINECLDLWNDIRLPGEGYFFKEKRYDNPGMTGLALTEKVIDLFTLEDEAVLDPFMGSGTTAEACFNLRRDFVGIEQSPYYRDMSQDRLDALLEKQGPIFPPITLHNIPMSEEQRLYVAKKE